VSHQKIIREKRKKTEYLERNGRKTGGGIFQEGAIFQKESANGEGGCRFPSKKKEKGVHGLVNLGERPQPPGKKKSVGPYCLPKKHLLCLGKESMESGSAQVAKKRNLTLFGGNLKKVRRGRRR